jgi:hypothetical protein
MHLTLITGNSAVDNTTAAIAAGAVASPVWLPWLEAASSTAAMIAPILGTVWLVVQIVAKVREMRGKDRE